MALASILTIGWKGPTHLEQQDTDVPHRRNRDRRCIGGEWEFPEFPRNSWSEWDLVIYQLLESQSDSFHDKTQHSKPSREPIRNKGWSYSSSLLAPTCCGRFLEFFGSCTKDAPEWQIIIAKSPTDEKATFLQLNDSQPTIANIHYRNLDQTIIEELSVLWKLKKNLTWVNLVDLTRFLFVTFMTALGNTSSWHCLQPWN